MYKALVLEAGSTTCSIPELMVLVKIILNKLVLILGVMAFYFNILSISDVNF
jgi:hypothetical protein